MKPSGSFFLNIKPHTNNGERVLYVFELVIALKKQVVAFFGPTVSQEIELYNRGEIVIAKADCTPCYRKECNQPISCMERLDTKTVFSAVKIVVAKIRK